MDYSIVELVVMEPGCSRTLLAENASLHIFLGIGKETGKRNQEQGRLGRFYWGF
jgi:hypothetical protein